MNSWAACYSRQILWGRLELLLSMNLSIQSCGIDAKVEGFVKCLSSGIFLFWVTV